MTTDRSLLMTGDFDRYWTQVRTHFQPGDHLAVLLPQDLYADDRFQVPYSLLGTYNYSCLDHILNISGYSQTAPIDQLYARTSAHYPFGAYMPEQKAALLAELPHLKFITLESLHPLKITLSSADGPTIDLTPLIPSRVMTYP